MAARAEAPQMPVPPPDTLRRGGSPYVMLESGHRCAIGWQDTKNDGPCFLVVRLTVMDSIKILDRFPLTQDGWAQAWAALVKLDAGAAQVVAEKVRALNAAGAAHRAESERQSQVYEMFAKAGDATVFRWLGMQVAGDDNVYTVGSHNPAAKTNSSRLLGPLAGTQAMVTDGSQAWSPGRAMFLPIGLTGLATKTKADAAVVFADGTVHTVPLDGNLAVREAQKQVVQFNALAGVSVPSAATDTAIEPAVRLRKLQELLDAGLVTKEEYEAKRAEIINSI